MKNKEIKKTHKKKKPQKARSLTLAQLRANRGGFIRAVGCASETDGAKSSAKIEY
jgi:hypothetical protein